MIFLQGGRDTAVQAGRRSEPAVLGDQGDRGVLRDHEAGAHTPLCRQERRKAADHGIEQAVESAFCHRSHFGDGGGQRIHGETDGCTHRVCAGEDLWCFGGAANQRVVRRRVQLAIDDFGHVRKDIARRPVHMRHRAQAERILQSQALTRGEHFAASQKCAKVFTNPRQAGRRAHDQRILGEGRRLAAKVLETHRGDDIGPLEQSFGAGQRQAGEARHAWGAVDEAQALLGFQYQGRQAKADRSLGSSHAHT